MIDVKTAVARAAEYAKEWLGSTKVFLEEVELSKRGDSSIWLITLSIPRRDNPDAAGGFAGLALSYSRAELLYGGREYKVFEVDAETAEVRSMKIRDMIRNVA
jgi:uncharacterized protein YdgA (DUF945 family)